MVNKANLMKLLILCLICQLSAAESFTWGTVMMGGGGFVSAIITTKAEKNLIYARTDVGGGVQVE
ncbi:MAG TPA: hypothetical protein VHO70_22350 [Chitinispirillaceae bacterium]|nr:hypothetical protein [Chitinispirillaceae bacterium]